MAGGNLGDLWFNLSVKSNVKQDLNAIGELLQGLDLKSARTRKDLEGIFGVFNKSYAKEISEDFKNIAAQMNIQQAEAAKLSARLRELAKLKADIIERDRQSTEHGAFVAMQNESQQAQALAQRYTELAKLKENILARDKEMEAHGAFVAMVNESRQAQELAQRERELLRLKEAIIRRNDEMIAAENRLAEATRRTNQARQEAVAHTRQQAEALVKLRVQELEAQRRQIQGLFGQGKNILPTEELAHLRSAFSQITQELNTLRTAMSNLGSYSARDLFSMGRGTSDFTPLISNMRAVVSEKQKAIQLEEKHRQEIAATAARVRGDLVSAFEQARRSASGVNSTVQDLKNLFLQGGLVYGVQQFANSIIQTGGEIVQQHIALRSIIGDVAKADELFKQTQELALQSPFKFGELNRDVKQLAAFGVEANELYETTKRLADISSGLGVSFERLGLAYGQVKARSWLDGKELRQFAYAGLPLLKSIAELYNSTAKNGKTDYTEGDIKKMISQREVSFDDVKQVLWGLTDEGGKFYNMQFVLSDTLLGKWNKLIDAWDIMLGRFAEGENVIGGTFKLIIDGVTSLVLMIDKFSPALLAFGGMLALRKGAGAIAAKTGIASELAALGTAQQLELRRYMVEQNRLVLEGQITREQATQNIMNRGYLLADTQTKMNAMEKLAIEGKLSLLQMQKAVREGLISKELIRQLEIMGLISSKQSELITKEGALARLKLGANQGMGKLRDFFSGWNLATLGVTIGMAMYSAYSSFKEKIKQESDQINENAKSNFKALSETLSEVSPKADYGGDLQAQVDKMKEVLEQSGLYTDTIKKQIDNCNDLNKEYDILRQKIIDAKEASKNDSKYADAYAEAKAATGAPWFIPDYFDQNIDESTDDMAKAFTSLQLKMEKFGDATKASMDKAATSILGAGSAGMTLEEKLSALYYLGVDGGDQWYRFVETVGRGNKELKDDLGNLGSDLDDFGYSFGQITNDDIPKYLESMRKSMGMSQTKFAEWCRKNPVLFKSMLDQMLSEANRKVPELVARLQQITRSILNLSTATPQPNNKGPKVWKNPLKVGTVERTTFDNLYKSGKLSGGKGGFLQKEMAEFIKSLNNGKSSGWYDFGEAVRKKYRDVRNENDSAKSAGQAQPMYRQQKMLETIAAQNGINLDVGKNKVTGNFGKGKKGSKEDKELDALKEKISLYKTYYSELRKYQKLYGGGAEERLKSSKDFAPVYKYGLTELSDYGGSIKQLIGSLPQTTKDRKDFANKSIASISSKDRELESERISDVNKDLREKLDLLSKEYDIYKQLYELTGDRKSSMQMAFGGQVQSTSLKDRLKNEMEKVLPEANERSGQSYTVDEVLAMSEKDFNAAYGENSEGISEVFNKYKDELKKVKEETLDLMTKLITDNATIDQQIEDLYRKHEQNVKKIKESTDMSPEFKKRALEGEDKSYNEDNSKLEFQKFQQSSDWATVFDDLSRVSSKTIKTMTKDIEEFSTKAGLSIDVVKQLRDALDKLRAEQIERNPFGVMFSTMGEGNAIGSFIKNNKPVNGKYTVDKEAGKRMGMKAGSYSKDELENRQAGKYADFPKSIQSVANKFKALNDIMSPVLDLLAAYGKKDTTAGRIMKGGGDALGAAASTAGAFQTLSQMDGLGAGAQKLIGNLGPYGAAASAAISIIGSFAAAHDAALQKEIEASQQRQKEMENLTKNIKSTIESTLGGIYNFKISEVDKKLLYDNKSKYSSNTQAQISKGQRTGSAFDNEYASLMAQRDEVNKQMNAESKKKNSDSSAISDYKQQIRELDHEIETFIDDWAKDIYNIDLKDWASQLTDAIVEAWSKGEDAVDAYKDKVQELVKTLTKNMISQSILEIALEPVQEDIRNLLQKNEGKLQSDDVTKIADGLDKAVGNSVENIENILDALKAKGYDLSENGSLSVSNSIKSINEETADLLASYINAIRLDVSVNRENIILIAEAVKYLPNLNVIAQSQLEQLTTLVSLARTRNEMISNMYDWMRALTNGTKKLSVA
jgi:chromosome segregation ATPase